MADPIKELADAEAKRVAAEAEAKKKADADAEAARIAAEANAPEPDTIQVRFHRPLGIGGKDYPIGVHPVPMAHIEADRWFFDAHALEGNVAPADELAADGTPAKLPRKAAKLKK